NNVHNIRKLLRLVVEHGTASKADAAGYRVGGKTGTAEKPGTTSAGYSSSAQIASFVGAFPIDNPRYVLLAMVDEPKGTDATYGYATGGWVAAPVVSRVVERMGPLLGIRPVYEVPNSDKDPKNWVYYDGRRAHAVSF
ncbi:MAG: penicillin-binding transpeptidase domain-containing protein, partial [Rickettsiales bacterium]